jgi:diacylglycerol O-acyltransferase
VACPGENNCPHHKGDSYDAAPVHLSAAPITNSPAVVVSCWAAARSLDAAVCCRKENRKLTTPSSVALLVALLTATGTSTSAAGQVVAEFRIQMVAGVVVGAIGGRALLAFMCRVPLPSERLYTLRLLAGALAIHGLATVAHGSSLLPVFRAWKRRMFIQVSASKIMEAAPFGEGCRRRWTRPTMTAPEAVADRTTACREVVRYPLPTYAGCVRSSYRPWSVTAETFGPMRLRASGRVLAAGELSGIPARLAPGPVTTSPVSTGFHFAWRPPMFASEETAERAVRESIAGSRAGGHSVLAGGRSAPRAGRLQRLSPVDAANMRVESHGGPMHVAAIAVVDGTSSLDAAGRLRLEEVRADLERRLHLAPRLRQVLVRPRRGLGAPVWADDARFDISRHVRARPVAAPGDEAALLALCLELNQPPLDRSRPLWELWLLPGLADGSVGVLFRLHHAVADGVAAMAMMGVLFGAAPGAPPPPARPWRPAAAPGAWQLFTDSWRQRAAAAAAAGSRLRRPAGVVHSLGARVRQLRLIFGEGLAPRVSWNRPAGTRRRLLLARADLASAKAVTHAHGGTVNDVVLAAVAGGARRLLASRGELRPGMVLKVGVAAAARDPADLAPTGNRAAVMLVPLPVSEPDPARALAQLARLTLARKRYPPYQPSGRFAQRAMVWAMPRQHLVNLGTSNLPGPPEPLYLAGARILELFQVGVVQGNLTVTVGVLSYAGQLNVTILGDADTVPDLTTFAEGATEALTQLGARTTAGNAAPRH